MIVARPRSILFASFVVTSLVGVAFIAGFWLSSNVATAFFRAILFIASMGAVHWMGYRLYEAQETPVKSSRNVDFFLVRRHLPIIVLTQFPCLILGSVLLDGGRGFRTCIAAMVIHWVAIFFCAAKKRSEQTALDTFVIRWGFFPSLAFAFLVSSLVL